MTTDGDKGRGRKSQEKIQVIVYESNHDIAIIKLTTKGRKERE
jgi:hypothetical protein